MKKTTYNLLSAFVLIVLLSACNYLDITPVGQVIPQKTSEFRGLLNDAYKIPGHKALLNMRGTHFNPEDDPFGFNLDGFDTLKDIYTWNDVNPDHAKTREYPYISFYQVIFRTNEIITNGLSAEDDGSERIEQVVGEAHALRAYMYFELANMYAPIYDKSSAASTKAVPVTTVIDIEQKFPKASIQAVYDLILSDIEQAEKLMDVEQQTELNRYRFSLESLYALKARVLLYMQEWQKSAEAAQKVLSINKALENMNDDKYMSSTNYQSKEAMLSLEYVTTMELRDYASISNELVAMYKEGDLRPSKYFSEFWMGYLVANKVNTENERVSFRRSEVYLNLAEAMAHLKKESEAKNTLLELLKNRYTPEAFVSVSEQINALSGDKLLSEILIEREKELALEGHQWYDLRRTGQPEVKKQVKGTEYVLKKNDPRYTLQIPKSAREANPFLNE